MKTSEDAADWYRRKTVSDALSVNLADGVIIIVFYNYQFSRSDPERSIDPFEIFASVSRNEVQDWIDRSERLMSSNFAVGDAIVEKSGKYEEIRDNYIASNPGFSKRTYSHAIYLGASKACR